MQQLNKDNQYKEIAQATFPNLPYELQGELDCDLYELNDSLVVKIERSIQKRDSLLQADTAAVAPPETFLQTLYKRKERIKAARALRDTARVSEVQFN